MKPALQHLIILFFFLFCEWNGHAQVTYYQHIEPLLQKHCVTCHYSDGPAPFSLEKYEDARKRAKFLSYVTAQRIMPPWKADPAFQHYRNERILSSEEITLLRQWAEGGMPLGPSSSIEKTTFKNRSNEAAALTLRMREEYVIPSNNTDDFRFFYLPTELKQASFITGIRFQPGNKKRVHHSRLMVDTTGLISGIDGLSEMDSSIYTYQRVTLADEFLYGWVPGNFVFRFPEGFGKRLPANANLILNMHYSPSVLDGKDRSTVELYLASREEVSREVKTFVLRETDISNPPFFIPAGEKPTFYMSSGVIKTDMSLLTVQPHAHLLGKSFRAFAITAEGDLIPLVKVDDWDFDWQTTYEFQQLIHIPAGSVIVMEGTYDNTQDNIRNPYLPPRDAGYGWRTVDEMMNLIFYYTDYQPGDETLTLQYRQE